MTKPKNVGIIFNILMIALSIPILVVGIMIEKKADRQCGSPNTDTGKALTAAAGTLISVAVVGLLLNICELTCKGCRCFWFWLYVLFMVVCIVVGLGYTIFILNVSSKGSGIKLAGKGYQEYKLGSYSKHLQKMVKDDWNSTKACLIKTDVCTKFNNKYLNDTVEKFYKEPLTAIQSGCCKPSDGCGFTYSSPANWSDEIGVSDKNPDCKAWDNDPKVKCFNCESCKGAVADNLKNAYKKLGIISIVFNVPLVIVFVAYLFLRNKNPAEDDMTFDRNY
ncbi:Tetraspanin/Peripherin [Corchorus capsularis]|uniref:Tetraspanin/Peripherin n=1 Tax=Corchorus capsularis TaxID=210143 RepID=A0A1R3HH42_COCAP|nr:Tetraspanin/Peripherin [Corchorus capsularis]